MTTVRSTWPVGCRRRHIAALAFAITGAWTTGALPAQPAAARSASIDVTRIDARAFPVLRIEFRAQDDSGRFLAGLTEREVGVSLRRTTVPIRSIRTVSVREDRPELMLVLDVSGSMKPALDAVRAGAGELSRRLGRSMPVGVLLASDSVVDRRAPTLDTAAIAAALPSRADGRRTAIWDAIGRAVAATTDSGAGRRFVVAITDGLDNASRMSLDSLVRHVAGRSVQVFTIGYGPRVDTVALARIAAAGGGVAFTAAASAVPTTLARIGESIAAGHVMEVVVPETAMGGWDSLRVSLLPAPGIAGAGASWSNPILLDVQRAETGAPPRRLPLASLLGWLVAGLCLATLLSRRRSPRRASVLALFAATWVAGGVFVAAAVLALG